MVFQVLILLVVIKGYQFPRAVHVEATWGRECDKMVFLLDTSHLGHYMSQPNYREQVIFVHISAVEEFEIYPIHSRE